MKPLTLAIRTLPSYEGLPLPEYATPLSAGMDLRCALEGDQVLDPGQRFMVPTGICIAIPPGYEGQVRPRSGLAIRLGLGIINSPGTIDADYRGEIKVPLIHLGQEPVTLTRGMRIAQLIIAPVMRIQWQQSSELPETQRGAGGFGHTGAD